MTNKCEERVGAFFGNFDLDIAAAVVQQLGGFLDRLEPRPLSELTAGDQLPRESGVYRLHHGGAAVYVGKASNLRTRITEHARDLDGRHGISSADVSVVCAALPQNWAPFGAEDLLLRSVSGSWQNSGFGNNDPGRNRDRSIVDAKHWDMRFPINPDVQMAQIKAGTFVALDLLNALKGSAPFLLRFERTPEAFAQLESCTVELSGGPFTFWQIFEAVCRSLPGWQGTALPGYVIAYREKEDYPAAQRYVRAQSPV